MMNLVVGMNRIQESVSFSYDGERKVLSDINFHASQGMVCGIVGPSGGGKTTFLELLLRFYPLEEGSLRYPGVCGGYPDPESL